MVAVAPYPGSDIAAAPLFEKARVVVCGFRALPHIKCLGINQDTHLVRKIHQFCCRHVVGSADRVDTHFF